MLRHWYVREYSMYVACVYVSVVYVCGMCVHVHILSFCVCVPVYRQLLYASVHLCLYNKIGIILLLFLLIIQHNRDYIFTVIFIITHICLQKQHLLVCYSVKMKLNSIIFELNEWFKFFLMLFMNNIHSRSHSIILEFPVP